eukprot:Nitzschia sp. Nitz4//scaffold39_size137210//88015//89107//NITZ4_003210-RA/size137210-processed-gene-0.95-mRNA-1//1//CDS//3329550416//6721//frame0
MTAHLSTYKPRSILKHSESNPGGIDMKKVFFDEIIIKEYPIILGDNPAVSGGAPISIGWKPLKESVVDVDFYEYCRCPERKSRKKLILSVRRRAGFLLGSGYSLEEIAQATMEVEKTKELRAASLKSDGWSNPWEILSGAVETTGTALKRADVLGVGAVVGAGVQGMNTVVGVGADVTMQTGKLLVSGAKSSTRAVTGAGKNLVVKPVVVTGKAIGSGISASGRAVGNVVTSTGRALTNMVKPSTPDAKSGTERTKPKRTPSSDSMDSINDLTAMKIR